MQKLIIFILLLVSTTVFSQDNLTVKRLIVQSGVKYPEIVYAQAELETDNFTSRDYLFRYNIFGFEVNNQKMFFTSILECVEYYKRWQDKWYRGGDYYDFLECIYEDGYRGCVRFSDDVFYVYKLQRIVR